MALIDGLISYWKLDETSGFSAADSHGSNTGARTLGTINETGKINGAYGFSRAAANGVDCGNSATLNTDEISFSCWIKADSNTSNDYFLNKWTSGTGRLASFLKASDDKVWVEAKTSGGLNNIVSNTTISTGTFYHIVFTWDSTSGGIIYLNGTAVTTINTFSGALVSDSADFMIGALRSSDFLLAWDGDIDEVGVWDRPLTQSEVTELYNSGDGLAYPFAVGTNISLNIADVWKDVDSMQINIGDVWKDVVEVQQNIGDVWKTVF